ncbi:MAG: hypothetical protein FJ308_05950 [Planctomycetes bacterium]|nr:hypothetical protein [Planctomycetota bacterium]
MRFPRFLTVAFAFTTVFTCNTVFGQSTANQTFKVIVPTSVSISAPAAVTINHDETNSAQSFPAQAWVVKENAKSGVNVSFSTGSAFVNNQDATQKHDAKLTLAIGDTAGPGTWTIVNATDTTDYAKNDEVAQVSASSDGVGRANLNLTVQFQTVECGLFAAGEYSTVITGTVAAN